MCDAAETTPRAYPPVLQRQRNISHNPIATTTAGITEVDEHPRLDARPGACVGH
jgi:hypothetical protein